MSAVPPLDTREEILKLDESCISNPKSEILNSTSLRRRAQTVQSEISDFGFEMQDSSNFKISPPVSCPALMGNDMPPGGERGHR